MIDKNTFPACDCDCLFLAACLVNIIVFNAFENTNTGTKPSITRVTTQEYTKAMIRARIRLMDVSTTVASREPVA